jgi:hypothetical protein
LSTTPQLLAASDFTYLGGVTLPGSFEGLTYRPSTNTFFAIAHTGVRPYDLVELSFAHSTARIVKNWGPLDVNGDLDLKGSTQDMKALLYINDNELLVNAAQGYVNTSNQWALASISLKSGKPVLDGGPWYVPASIGSNAVGGSLAIAPAELQQLGYGLVMDGTDNPVAGTASWGLGYVGVQMPSLNLPAGSTLTAAQFVDWPTSYSPAIPFTHSDFPKLPGDAATMIRGNDNVGAIKIGVALGGSSDTITLANDGTFVHGTPPVNSPVGWYVTNETTGEQLLVTGWDKTTRVATTATPWLLGAPQEGTSYQLFLATYQSNTFYDMSNMTGPLDDMGPGVSIQLLDSSGQISTEGMFYVGQVGLGYDWYGNTNAHDDETLTGDLGNNDVTSMLVAGQDLTDVEWHRGWHTESRVLRWYIADPNAIAAAAQNVLAGTATSSDLEVSYASGGDLATLGGTLTYSVPHSYNDTGEMFFQRSATNPSTGVLYVLEPTGGAKGKSIVYMFQVTAPSSSNTAMTAMKGPAVDAVFSSAGLVGADGGIVGLRPAVQFAEPNTLQILAAHATTAGNRSPDVSTLEAKPPGFDEVFTLI